MRERNPLDALIAANGADVEFDVVLHRGLDGALLIELEPSKGPRPFSFPNTYLAVRGAVATLNQAADLESLYAITAKAVRELTDFDRVMVYRYDVEFNGEVVAEEKRDDLESFLGLHYPASDIPAQARALYERNWIRLISDVDYEPAPLIPNEIALDLTFSTLRSVSPIHLEYLRNMGVRASMSISLLRHGALWGLIACHHYSGPYTPPYGVRTASEFLGSTLSLRLVDRAQQDEFRLAAQVQAVLTRLTSVTHDEDNRISQALLDVPSLLDLIPADGVAVAIEGHHAVQGNVPDPETIATIAKWARSTEEDVIETDLLGEGGSDLGVVDGRCSGVLALNLPEDQFIIWFRPEDPRPVGWAGDPRSKELDGALRLSPRKSFARWQEVVRGRSEPWTPEQVAMASDLRMILFESLYLRSQREIRQSETLQRSLLPVGLPELEGWTLSAHAETAAGGRVGGDWYDVIELGESTVAVVLGDVVLLFTFPPT